MRHTLYMLALLLTLAVAPTGCKNPEQAALVAVTATNVSVDSSIGAFNDYRSTHAVPPATVARVRQLAQRYKAANVALGDAVTAYKLLANIDTQSRVEAAQQQLSIVGADLINLLRTIDTNLVKRK